MKNAAPTEATSGKDEANLQTEPASSQEPVVRTAPSNDQPVRTAEDSEREGLNTEPTFELTDDMFDDNFFADLLENADQLVEGLSLTPPPPLIVDMDAATTSREVQNHINGAPETSLSRLSLDKEPQSKELSGSQDCIKNEPAEGTELSSCDDACNDGSDLIASDFFDDLLVDEVAQHFERLEYEEKEIKFVRKREKIREELRQFDEEEVLPLEKPQHNKKHKSKKSKSEKKSRKHPKNKAVEIQKECSEGSERVGRLKERKRKRKHSSSEEFDVNDGDLPECPPIPIISRAEAESCAALPIDVDDDDDDVKMILPKPFLVPSNEWTNVEKDRSNNSGSEGKKLKKPTSSVELADPLVLTSPIKRRNALRLESESLRSHFASISLKNYKKTNKNHENRPPLRAISNVDHNRSSISRINPQDWDVEPLHEVAARVARKVDRNALFSKNKSKRVSRKNSKPRRERRESVEVTDGVDGMRARRGRTHNIGVQVRPMSASIGTQTTTAPSNDDLPVMQLIKVLNQNQLLALNDMAELTYKPTATAIDMYNLRTRMLNIYKSVQLPDKQPAAPE